MSPVTNVNRIRTAIFAEINRLNGAEQIETERPKGILLGAFIDSALNSTGHTRVDLARTLGMDSHLIDAILDGIMTDDEIDDLLLIDIAHAIDYDPNLLRLIMGRAIVPTRLSQSAK
jgi:hypothetical protein